MMSWCSQMPATRFHRSLFSICSRAFFDINDIEVSRYDALGLNEVMARWREVTTSPERKAVPDYFGSAKDCDVICFVLETAPAQCLDMNGNIDDMPNLKRLRERAWVVSQHVTAYPKTRRALFSILTSWYPSDPFGRSWEGWAAPHDAEPSGFGIRNHCIFTCCRVRRRTSPPSRRWHLKARRRRVRDAVHRQLGEEDPSGRGKPALDRAALQQMKDDISRWMDRDDQRYAVLYLPQIGHGPWPNISGDSTNHDVISRGRAIIALQDNGWARFSACWRRPAGWIARSSWLRGITEYEPGRKILTSVGRRSMATAFGCRASCFCPRRRSRRSSSPG